MCELWNPDTGDPRMNSWNHFALGSIGQWFYEELAGIHLDPSPGAASDQNRPHLTVRPRPADDLTWVTADYRSVFGPVRSHWHRTSDGWALEVTIPANTQATISWRNGGAA